LRRRDILNESYYGKNPELIQCENYLTDMKEYLMTGKNPNSCPSKDKFESTIANLFGFEKVYFSIIAEENFENGFTTTHFYDVSKNVNDEYFDLVKSKNGIRFKHPRGKILYVYSYNYSLRNSSVEKLMSIFLHEVGHNFFLIKEQVNYKKTKLMSEMVFRALYYLHENGYNPSIFPEVVKFLCQVSLEAKTGISKSTYEYYHKYIEDDLQNKAIKKEKINSNLLVKAISTSLKVIGEIFVSLLSLPFTITNLLLMPLYLSSGKSNKSEFSKYEKNSQGYNAEKFSDNFAASYGYGVGIVDMFSNSQNLSKKSILVSKIPVVRVLDYFNQSLTMFAMYYNDPHPDNRTRVLFMINKLRYELDVNKNQLDHRQIAEIEEQIIRMEKLISDAPYWKSNIDKMFKNAYVDRDKAGSVGVSDSQIYDFDTEILKDRFGKPIKNRAIKKESNNLSIKVDKKMIDLNSIVTESFNETLSKYLDINNNEPFLSEECQIIFEKFNDLADR